MVAIAVEDIVSQAVAQRLISEYAPGLECTQVYGLSGFGELKRKMPTFDKIAQYREPIMVLTDLDDLQLCLAQFRSEWCHSLQMPPDFMFRVAVAEIEAWLLADRGRIAGWLGISESLIPRLPETIPQPKECLVELARRSRYRRLREALVPQPGSTRATGPGYNDRVSDFATVNWNPSAARTIAPSLDRAIVRIGELAHRQSS